MAAHIGGHALAWYAVVFGLVLTLIKMMEPDRYLDKSPEDLIKKIKKHTRFVPSNWINNERSLQTYNEFENWFQASFMIYLYELLSVLFTPYLLIKSFRKNVTEISSFLTNYTIIDSDYGPFVKMSYIVEDDNVFISDEKMKQSLIGFKNYYIE